MYKIGEFSKIVDMPVRTVRYYDEVDVLKPEYVDQFSGYRYYTDNNVSEAEWIKMLRSTGFSLEEIVNCKSLIDADIINDKIDELNGIIDEISEKIQKLEIIRDEIVLVNGDVKVLRKTPDNISRAA
ncbi:MAG: MerR family transcriptional regulator [Bacilli bacterium]|nr:MerR family transcriptional regulator [Bacilli bacterium]MDE6141902.1 MerR family transcriptional regulator [Bacilli bacterium]